VDTTANDEQLVLEDGCSSTLFVTMYTLVYNMCTQRSTYNCSEQLYERYDGTLRAFVGAYSEVMLTDLTAVWQCYNFFATVLSKPFKYLDRYYIIHHHLPTLRGVSCNVFRSAMDTAYGSADAANAALNECSEITDRDKQLLLAAQSSTAILNADVMAATVLNIVVREKNLKLANLCLKQLRATLASEIEAVSATEQKVSLSEQLRVVTAVLAGNLTLNELREEWQKWSSSSTHISSIWSAFNKAETSCSTTQDADDDYVKPIKSGDDGDDDNLTSAERPAKKAKIV
jgi:Cullin family